MGILGAHTREDKKLPLNRVAKERPVRGQRPKGRKGAEKKDEGLTATTTDPETGNTLTKLRKERRWRDTIQVPRRKEYWG